MRGPRNSKSVVNITGPDTKLVREISALFGRAKGLIFANLERPFAAQGESVQTWRALSQLKKLGRVAQFELAEALAQHPGGISRLLDGIERAGLVKRQREVHDRRKVWSNLLHVSNEDCRTLSKLLSKIMEPGPAKIQAD